MSYHFNFKIMSLTKRFLEEVTLSSDYQYDAEYMEYLKSIEDEKFHKMMNVTFRLVEVSDEKMEEMYGIK